MSGPIFVYDFTLGCQYATVEDVKRILTEFCKKWTFQREISDNTGFEHFQGRFSLKHKMRRDTLKNKLPWKEIHLSPTSNENSDNDFYATKEDTRIEGPWKDTDEVIYIPRQVREIQTWYPWQISVCEKLSLWDTRSIHCIVDAGGNKGKSTLASALGSTNKACQIPFCNDFKDIMRMVMDQPKVGAYLIDMPRAVNKEKLYQLYGAIEIIKGGYAYDDRYSFRKAYFDCPNIFVFTNKCPDLQLLTTDRWKLWMINDNMELVEYVPPAEIASNFAIAQNTNSFTLNLTPGVQNFQTQPPGTFANPRAP